MCNFRVYLTSWDARQVSGLVSISCLRCKASFLYTGPVRFLTATSKCCEEGESRRNLSRNKQNLKEKKKREFENRSKELCNNSINDSLGEWLHCRVQPRVSVRLLCTDLTHCVNQLWCSGTLGLHMTLAVGFSQRYKENTVYSLLSSNDGVASSFCG